jgi:hypothetical protein
MPGLQLGVPLEMHDGMLVGHPQQGMFVQGDFGLSMVTVQLKPSLLNLLDLLELFIGHLTRCFNIAILSKDA